MDRGVAVMAEFQPQGHGVRRRELARGASWTLSVNRIAPAAAHGPDVVSVAISAGGKATPWLPGPTVAHLAVSPTPGGSGS